MYNCETCQAHKKGLCEPCTINGNSLCEENRKRSRKTPSVAAIVKSNHEGEGRMSNWIEVTDHENIEIDGEDINILYSEDKFGNNYIHFKKQMIIDLLAKEKAE